jgi:hypothetical protein
MAGKSALKASEKKQKTFYWYSRAALPPFLALLLLALAFFWLENEFALLVLLPIAGAWLGWRVVARFNGNVKNAFAAGVLAYLIPLALNACAFYLLLTAAVVPPKRITYILGAKPPLLESVLFNSLANFAVFIVFVLASAALFKFKRRRIKTI